MKKGVIKPRTSQGGEWVIEPNDNKSIGFYNIAKESKHLIEGNAYREVTFTVNEDHEAVIQELAPESKL
jgi:hypothetical protein